MRPHSSLCAPCSCNEVCGAINPREAFTPKPKPSESLHEVSEMARVMFVSMLHATMACDLQVQQALLGA